MPSSRSWRRADPQCSVLAAWPHSVGSRAGARRRSVVEQCFTDVVMQSEGAAAYLVIFGVLVACGLGVPLPEDISLLTGGFLAYLEVANLFAMMAVGFVGILCGD